MSPGRHRLETTEGNLERNVVAVVLGMGLTGVLGVVYWGVAARLFPPAEVGRASAIINGTQSLSVAASLSIGAIFERFLLPAGRRALPMAAAAFGLTALVGLVVGAVYVGANWNSEIFDGPMSKAALPLWVVVIVWFGLFDQTTAGLRVARWGAMKNTVHSVVKVAALVPAAIAGTWLGIVLTWMVPAAILAVVLGVMVYRRLLAMRRQDLTPRLPSRAALARYAGSTLWLTLLGQLAPLLMPLLVVSRVGLEANAYFSVTWALVSAVIVMLGMIGGPLVAEVVADPDNVSHYLRRFAGYALVVAIAGAVGLGIVGPFLMGWIHAEYQAQTTTALRLFGLAMPFLVVTTLFLPLSRVVRRLTVAMVCEGIMVSVFLGGGWYALPKWGISGLAGAFLVAEVLNAIMLAVPLFLLVRRIREQGVDESDLVG